LSQFRWLDENVLKTTASQINILVYYHTSCPILVNVIKQM